MVTNDMRAPHRPSRRHAFSLAELVISIAVLILMLSLAAQVLTITVDSTGQATGLTEVNVQLRVLEDLLRRDLAAAHPGRTPMLIQGNPVNAYWTREQQEADNDNNPSNGGYRINPALEDADGDPIPPRADILMFFTQRRAESFLSPGVFTNAQQVVYGHAEFGNYEYGVGDDVNPPEFTAPTNAQLTFPLTGNFYPSRTAASPLPASQWYLARRTVGLLPGPAPAGVIDRDDDGMPDVINMATPESLGDPRLLRGQYDLAAGVDYDRFIVGSWQSDTAFPPTAPWRLPYFFFSNPWVPNPTPADLDVWPLPMMPDDVTVPYARSQFDPTPPAEVADTLGHALLPACASFKVEWTLSPRSEFVAGRLDGTREVIWLDPGELNDAGLDSPLESLLNAGLTENTEGNVAVAARLASLLGVATAHPNGDVYSMLARFDSASGNRWQDVGGLVPEGNRNNLALFLARMRRVGEPAGQPFDLTDPAVPTASEEPPDDIFPSALRITVDVYDRQGRLDKPVRHVMVIPVGGT